MPSPAPPGPAHLPRARPAHGRRSLAETVDPIRAALEIAHIVEQIQPIWISIAASSVKRRCRHASVSLLLPGQHTGRQHGRQGHAQGMGARRRAHLPQGRGGAR